MRIALVQHDIAWLDPAANHERLAPKIAAAAGAGARLVVLSEMFATGFSMDIPKVAEPADGPTRQFLLDVAAANGVWVCGTVATRVDGDPEGKARNRLVLAGPDGAMTTYDKIHPFTYAREDESYVAGDRHVSVEVEGVRVSFFVCYDLRFADEFWALAHNTDLYVVSASWPEARRHHWKSLLVARAIENQAYVAGLNRVGEGDGLVYAGDSAVIDPLGETLGSAARGEALVVVDVDPTVVADTRERFPFLADRR